MLNLKQRIVLAGAALSIGSSCAMIDSDTVDQEEIYTRYEAEYNADPGNDSLNFKATFKTGENNSVYVRLVSGSRVSVDGEPMEEDGLIFDNVHYTLEQYGLESRDLWARHHFSYINNDGEVFENSFYMPDPIELRVPNDAVIDRDRTHEIGWRARASVLSTDRLRVQISQVSTGREEVLFPSGSGYEGSFTVHPEDLSGFEPGTLEFRICRRVSETASAAPAAGGDIDLITCSKREDVQLLGP